VITDRKKGVSKTVTLFKGFKRFNKKCGEGTKGGTGGREKTFEGKARETRLTYGEGSQEQGRKKKSSLAKVRRGTPHGKGRRREEDFTWEKDSGRKIVKGGLHWSGRIYVEFRGDRPSGC